MAHRPSGRFPGVVHSAARIVIGFLFACHGAATLFGIFGGAAGTHGGSAPVGSWPAWWSGLIELVVGVLVGIGLFTRPAAILGSGAMAYAYFTVHQAHALLPIQNGGEAAALFSWIFLLLALVGPGTMAVDNVLRRRLKVVRTESAPRKSVELIH